jgi:hypothetical protein
VRSNMGLAYLASGRFEQGEREIMRAADEAAQSIFAALIVKKQPPASSWSLLEAIALDLDNLWMRMDGNDWFFNEAPSPAVVADLDGVKKKSEELRDRVSNIAVALEETGKLPSQTPPAAKVTNMTVSSTSTRSSTRVVRGPELPAETVEVELQFRYEGMRRGQKVLWRVFHNGQQDRLLGRHREWSLDNSGTATFSMSYAYSTLYHFSSGYYVVEMFIDQQLVGRTSFTVESADYD